MITTTLQLDQETFDAVAAIAREQGKSTEDVMRDAICRIAQTANEEPLSSDQEQATKRVLPTGMGKYRSGRSDISENAKEILKEHFSRRE